jgi:putative transposase
VDRRRHSTREINALLLRADDLAAQGKLQKDIARALGVSVMTLHRWRKAKGGKRSGGAVDRQSTQRAQLPLESDMDALIEELERENARLRMLVTDLLLEKARLEETLTKPRAGRFRHMLSKRLAKA